MFRAGTEHLSMHLFLLLASLTPVLANVTTLRDAASKHGLLIGAATNVRHCAA
jgi:hypothetical protein